MPGGITGTDHGFRAISADRADLCRPALCAVGRTYRATCADRPLSDLLGGVMDWEPFGQLARECWKTRPDPAPRRTFPSWHAGPVPPPMLPLGRRAAPVATRDSADALLVTPAIAARGAERHGSCVTPQSGCHELLMFRVAGLTSEVSADVDGSRVSVGFRTGLAHRAPRLRHPCQAWSIPCEGGACRLGGRR